jgi:hypothetical protein
MKDLFEKFLQLMHQFELQNIDYILIGGMAVNLQGFARNTDDIDVFIKLEELNIDNLRTAMFNVFNDNEINEITYEELEKFSVIRYGAQDGFYIDIISRIGEEFSFNHLNYEEKEIDGVKIKVADVKTLYKLKEHTYREIDQLDLKFLKSKLEN